MSKKIALYGGTFDPIHFGHLNVASEMMEKWGLDEIWFCPAYINPHKLKNEPTATPKQRLEMLHLAIDDRPSFKVVDVEIRRSGPSYTYDTLQYILSENGKQKQPDQFFLIIGEDSVPGFFSWHEPEKIVQNVSLLVASRSQELDISQLKGNELICNAIIKGWTPVRRMEISSTEIRTRLRNKLDCEHLIPYKTLCYIYKNQLYF